MQHRKRKQPMDGGSSSSEPSFKRRKGSFQSGAKSTADADSKRHKAKHPFKRSSKSAAKVLQTAEKKQERQRMQLKIEAMLAQKKGNLSKKELREMKRERKALKTCGKVRTELNALFAQQNIKDQPRKAQVAYVAKLVAVMKGSMVPLARALDSTKVIQTAVKYGTSKQVFAMASELKGHFIDLSCELYAHTTVQRMLEYGKKDTRELIVSELMKAVVRLVTHKLASTVADYAIMVAAKERTRRLALQYIVSRKYVAMPDLDSEGNPRSLQQILGDLFSVPDSRTSDDLSSLIAKQSEADASSSVPKKKKDSPGVSDFVVDDDSDNGGEDDDDDVEMDAGKKKKKKAASGRKSELALAGDSSVVDNTSAIVARRHLLKNMERFLTTGIEKEIVSTGVYQSILFHYMCHCSRFDFESMFELLTPHICEIQNVESGTLAINVMVSRSFFKAALRKTVMKALSQSALIVPMACDKTGYLTIIRLLQCVDDTKLLDKRVLKPLLQNLDIVCFHDFGRLVLLALLKPLDSRLLKTGGLFPKACPPPVDIDAFKRIVVSTLLRKSQIKSKGGGDEKEDETSLDLDPEIEKLYRFSEVNGDFSKVDAENHKSWSVIPQRLRPVSLKSPSKRNEELLKYMLPSLVRYCKLNAKKMLTHPLAGSLLCDVLSYCLKAMTEQKSATDSASSGGSDAKSSSSGKKPRSIVPMKGSTELIDAVVKCCVADFGTRSLSMLPPLPQVNSKITLADGVSDDSPHELKMREVLNYSQFLVAKLKFDILLTERKAASGSPQKARLPTLLSVPCVMNHSLGHRRIRNLCADELLFREQMMAAIQKLDAATIKELLKLKGVFVVLQLVQSADSEVQKCALKESVQSEAEKLLKELTAEDPTKKYSGLKQLIQAFEE